MDVDLRKLRYFVAAARLEHVGRAAEELFITQPVLSRQLRSLERDLGVELFTRAARGVRLTAAGRQLLEDAGERARHHPSRRGLRLGAVGLAGRARLQRDPA